MYKFLMLYLMGAGTGADIFSAPPKFFSCFFSSKGLKTCGALRLRLPSSVFSILSSQSLNHSFDILLFTDFFIYVLFEI